MELLCDELRGTQTRPGLSFKLSKLHSTPGPSSSPRILPPPHTLLPSNPTQYACSGMRVSCLISITLHFLPLPLFPLSLLPYYKTCPWGGWRASYMSAVFWSKTFAGNEVSPGLLFSHRCLQNTQTRHPLIVSPIVCLFVSCPERGEGIIRESCVLVEDVWRQRGQSGVAQTHPPAKHTTHVML